MDRLKEIINSNIEWFWQNDVLVEQETDISKLWDGYKVFCVQNCMEVMNAENISLNETEVTKMVEDMYAEWLASK